LATQTDTAASESGLPGLWHNDLPTIALAADAEVEWKLRWEEDPPRWEGRNFQVRITPSKY
jgi:hypothetical protein